MGLKGRGEKDHYVIKLPKRNNTLKPESLTRLNLRIKSKAMLYQNTPDDIIDFAELNVTDTSSINIKKGKRNYMNKCHNRTISDLTEESLEIQNITILSNEGIKWSLSIGLVNYFIAPEYQCIVLRMNNKFYKINNYDLELEEVNYNSVNYHKPDEGGLQIYHNQPSNNNNVGLVDLKDKSILDFDMKVVNNSLLLSYKDNTLVRVENWNNYQPASKMMFAFNETIVPNSKRILSNYSLEDIITEFNTAKKVLSEEEKERPRQRKRRHHHRDHDRHHGHLSHKFLPVDSSNQPEIAASSGTRPSSWINSLAGSLVNKAIEVVQGITQFMSSSYRTILPSSSSNERKINYQPTSNISSIHHGSNVVNKSRVKNPDSQSSYGEKQQKIRYPNSKYTAQFSVESCVQNNLCLFLLLLQNYLNTKFPPLHNEPDTQLDQFVQQVVNNTRPDSRLSNASVQGLTQSRLT